MAHNTTASTRMERINSTIAHEISQYLLFKMDDKRIKAAQINRVETSKDLSQTKVYFIVLEEGVDIKHLTKLLNNAAGVFRQHIAKTLDLRVTPEVRFFYDQKAVETQHLLDLLSKI